MKLHRGIAIAFCAGSFCLLGCSTGGDARSLGGNGGGGGLSPSDTMAKGGSTSGSSAGSSASGGATTSSSTTAAFGGVAGTSTPGTGGVAGSSTTTATTLAAGGSGAIATSAAGGAGGTIAGADAGPSQDSPDFITATKDEGWLQLFDTGGPISAFGPWATYTTAGGACAITPNGQPPKGATGICFSGKGCASAGAGIGVEICKTYPAYQHWTVMVNFCAAHGMSGNNVRYGFGSCNTGYAITAIHWEGAIPAGFVVDVHDPANQSLAKMPVAAGTTSVTLPPATDGSKVASIHFNAEDASVQSWDFCIAKLWVSYR